MLALDPSIGYVHDPFNPDSKHSIPSERWYTYATDGDEALRACYKRLLNFRYPLGRAISESNTLQELYEVSQSWARWSSHRLRRKRPLVKDPISLLSANWVAKQFDVSVIVMVRHPAGFAGSLKKQGWNFPFHDLSAQPQLIDTHFASHRREIERFAEKEQKILDQAAFIWKLLHEVVLKFQKKYPCWTFLRHEDVARDPAQVFQRIYESHDLDFTEEVKDHILALSEPARSTGRNGPIHRDSEATIRNWTTRLTRKEIYRVHEWTEEVASEFYDDGDWFGYV